MAQHKKEEKNKARLAASGLVLAAQWKDKKEYKSRLKSLLAKGNKGLFYVLNNDVVLGGCLYLALKLK